MVSDVLFAQGSTETGTPTELWEQLHREFRFTIDLAAADDEPGDEFRVRRQLELRDLEERLRRRRRRPGETDEVRDVRLAEELERRSRLIVPRRANALLPTYYTIKTDALAQTWTGSCFLNPPFGTGIRRWVEKARTSTAGRHATADVVAMVLPVRSDVSWFHAHVWDAQRHRAQPGVEVRFLPGRVRFAGMKVGAPFPTMVVVFRRPK